MDAPGPWYSSVTFLTTAGIVVSLLGTLALAWVTFRVGLLRRRLIYGLKAPSPLLRDLEFDPRGEVVPADRRVLTVELKSRSRRDIPSDAYNDHEPLQLDIGSYIVEVIHITSEPETLPVPKIAVDGTSLNIGPSLIGKRHDIKINVLVDGSKSCPTYCSPLIDVEVRGRADERKARYVFALASMAILSVVVVAAFVVVWLGSPSTLDLITRVLEIIFAPLVLLVGVALAIYYRDAK